MKNTNSFIRLGQKGKRPFAFSIPHILFLLRFLLTAQLLLWPALAVTYSTNPANGPENLSQHVTQAFADWQALDSKLEVSQVDSNPESRFEYGAAERFSPDMLSITIQRQQDIRQLIHIINPNTENQGRILLHEVGIAIGLTAQVPPALQSAKPEISSEEFTTEPDANPAEEAIVEEENTPGETDPAPSTTTEESAHNDESTAEETSEASPENTSSTDAKTTENSEETQNSTNDEAVSSSDTAQDAQEPKTSEPSPSEIAPAETGDTNKSIETTDQNNPLETTPVASNIQPWQTVMNPGVTPNDASTLGEGEKELLKVLNLFAKEDINKDGNVNFYDLVALSQAFGQRNVNDPADINRDGIVNQADVDLLRKAYTFSDPSATAPGQTEANPEGQTSEEPLPEQTSDPASDETE